MKKISLLILLCSIILLANAQTVPTCNPFPKTITVTGSAEMNIVPDEIYAVVLLQEYKKKGEEKTDLEKIKTDFFAKCKTAGIADSLISISSYQGYNANLLYWKKRKKDPDMFSSIAYEIKFSDNKKMDALMNILDDEATSNFSIARTASSKMQEYKKQIKALAIKAAKEKGIYLTEAIGEKLGEAITITELSDGDSYNYLNQNVFGKPRDNNARLYMQDSIQNNDTQIDFKKIRLRSEVKIIFALK